MFKFNFSGLAYFLVVVLACSFILGCLHSGGGNNNEVEGGSIVTEDAQGGEPFDTETIMLPGGVPLEMVWIPSGTFQMGAYDGEQRSASDEKPQHQVTLTQGFWMGKYELTKAQWVAVMNTTPWSGKHQVLDNPDSPAVFVSWNDAQSFITALNTLSGKTFRLPTEAEWEYACRAGTKTRFYWGDDPNTVGNDYVWWSYNTLDVNDAQSFITSLNTLSDEFFHSFKEAENEKYAHVVGQKLSNASGLYDMSGNVWEWCQDWYGSSYYLSSPSADPTGPDSGENRVLRGGSWYDYGDRCRSANRISEPSDSDDSLGFRLAR